MIFHIFICILHLYYELTKWPAPRWLDRGSWRGGGYKSHFPSPNFVQIPFPSLLFFQILKIPVPVLLFFGLWFPFPVTKSQSQWPKSHFPSENLPKSQFPFYPFRTLLITQLGALHRYRRSHGFESCSGLNFFQALISQLLKLCV